MFFKFIIALSVILNVSACPAAKKAILRQDGKKMLHASKYIYHSITINQIYF